MLYAFVGGTAMYFNLVGIAQINVTVYNQNFALTSPTLVVGLIATVLFYYLESGTKQARNMMLAIFVGLLISIFFPLYGYISLKLNIPAVSMIDPEYIDFYETGFKTGVASTLTLIIDLFVSIIVFQYILNKTLKTKRRTIKIPIIGAIALTISSLTDAILFPLLLTSIHQSDLQNIVARIPVFFLASISYSIILSIYVHHLTEGKYFEYIKRPTLDILMRKRKFIPIELFLRERKRMDVLFDIMNHDLKNILQVYTNSLELLRNIYPEIKEEYSFKSLNNVFRRLKKISFLYSSMEEFQKQKEEDMYEKQQNLSIIINNTIDYFNDFYSEMYLEYIIVEKPVYCYYNPLLENAIIELLDNAVIYSEKKNEKKIELVYKLVKIDSKRYAKISIIDYNEPMNNELKKILEDPIRHIKKRIGLGFIIVKTACDFSDGFYEINQRENGNTISIFIPVIIDNQSQITILES